MLDVDLPPKAEVLDALQYAIAPAAGATLSTYAVYLLLNRFSSRTLKLDLGLFAPLIGVVALLAGLAAANYYRLSLPWTPDQKWWHDLIYAIALAGVVEAVARFSGVPLSLGQLLRGTAAGLIAAALVSPSWQTDAHWWMPLAGLTLAIEWGAVGALAIRTPGPSLLAALTIALGGASAILLHASSARFADVALFTFVGLAVLTILARLSGTDPSSAAAVAVVPLVTLLLVGRALADTKVPLASFLSVGLAPLGLFVFFIPGVDKIDKKPAAGWLQIVLVLIPVAYGVYRAMTEAPLQFSKEAW